MLTLLNPSTPTSSGWGLVDGVISTPAPCPGLKSPYTILYSNIVKPSLIGDGLHCLLKVIPMCYKQSDSYHTYEFEHNEFLPIATSVSLRTGLLRG